MPHRSRWMGIGIAIAIALLVVLLLPRGAFLIGGAGSPGRPGDRPLPRVAETFEHWKDRIMNLDFTGPRGIFADSSSFNLVLVAGIIGLLLFFAPRLILLALALIVGLPFLIDLISAVLPGQQPGAPGSGGRAPWERLFGGSTETLLLLGILVVIGIAFMQRRQPEDRLIERHSTSADDR